jgi:hypothetical protein
MVVGICSKGEKQLKVEVMQRNRRGRGQVKFPKGHVSSDLIPPTGPYLLPLTTFQ